MFLSYRDGLSFYRQNHKYPMRCGLAEGLTEEPGRGVDRRSELFPALPTPWVAGAEGGPDLSETPLLHLQSKKNQSTHCTGLCVEDSGTGGTGSVSLVPGMACAKARGWEQRREGSSSPGQDCRCQAGLRAEVRASSAVPHLSVPWHPHL